MSIQNGLKWHTRVVPAGQPEALAARHQLPPLVARVLAARGWQPGPDLSDFLGGGGGPALDPLGLAGVPEAAERLWQAIDRREPIVVCGDYDVDGVTGAALLVGFLRQAGALVDVYLPHRYDDGYGLNARVLRGLAERGAKLLVTVDNGVSSHAELALAAELGMEAIVTDHHTPGAVWPEVRAIVHPRRMDEPGPYGGLSGVGVAYEVARGMEALRPGRVSAPGAEGFLDLVAIGTIGDMAPLHGENRRMVKRGVEAMARAPRVGLATLARATRVSLDARTLTEQIAFRLIPRLNAAGRLAHPRLAFDLLLAEDPREAERLAAELDQLNRRRQVLCEGIEQDCRERLAVAPEAPAIVLADAGWHHGVMGIVASRLAERYQKPALVFAKDGDAWRGSGRSIAGLNLHAVLQGLEGHLRRFGGHAAAVGLTVPDEAFPGFVEAFQAACERALAALPDAGAGGWAVDCEVPLSALTLQSVEGLACLQPTGAENPAPTLATRGARVLRQGVRGPEGQHLWLELADEGGKLEAIGFGMGHLHPVAPRVDAIFVPVAETWQGRARLQLRLLALEGREG